MTAVAARERVSTLLFYGTVLLLAYFLYLLFSPFFAPLAWAAILASFFYAPYRRLAARFGPTTAASMATVAVMILIIVPVVLVTMVFVQQASSALGSIDLSVQT